MTTPNRSPLPPGEGQGEGHNLLTTHLPLLAGAPNGIKKLRELILELAVRGKLVPQDPTDEPASEQLKRIVEEKARLVAEGKIKKQKPLTERDDEAPAFELPAGWAWARLSDVVNVLNGRAYKKEELLDAGTPVLRVGNLFTSNHWYYSNLTLEEDKYCNPGDLLFAWSASFGPFIWQGERSIYHYHIWKLDFYAQGQLSKHYLYNFLLEQTQEIKAAGHGVSMVHMTKEKMEKLAVPVPPLAEQHRVVTKVDELMALCDRLEARQANAESAHAQLVQALLDSLTQASDATDFATSWQRLAEHFHTLFTNESRIDTLKQTLLQLAVMGKLVPQAPNDEPASELLKRIAEEKARLAAEGKIKKQKRLREVGEEEQLFDLPKGWVWSRFGDICAIQGELVRPEDFPDLRQVAPDCIEKGTGRLTESRTVKESGVKGPNSRFYSGQIVYSKIRPSLSKAVLVDFDGLCSADMYPLDAFIDSQFLLKEILSEVFLEQVRVAENRIKMPKLNQESLTGFVLPIPPITEQHRIVAKVDQLMALCDQLKARLGQARQVHEHLASALVENALSADRQQTPAITDRKAARTLLAAEITHQLHGLRTFGQRKLQKVIHLAEHAAQLAAIQGSYLRDAAGPHDRQLMDQVEGGLHNHQWYERIDRDTVGHAYRPLPAAGQHRPEYENTWSTTERATIRQVIDLMRGWDTDRCERVVTLYAAWNDFLLEGKSVTDEMLVHEVMYSWNDTKLRFTEAQWLTELCEMKKQKLLIPTGFGKRTQGGMPTLTGLLH